MRNAAVAALVIGIAVAAGFGLYYVARVPTAPVPAKSETPAAPTVAPPGIGWRGDGTGRFPDVTPPLHWDESHGVVWKTHLPDRGNGTPVLAGDIIFVTAEPDLLVAVNAADGKILWQRQSRVIDALTPAERVDAEKAIRESTGLEEKGRQEMAELASLKRDLRKAHPPPGAQERIAAIQSDLADLQQKIDRAAPFVRPPDFTLVGTASITPVTDGRTVYVAYGTFVVAAYDFEGKQKWIRYLPHAKERKERGRYLESAASPRLVGNVLVLPLVDLYGLDTETGRTLWTGPRIFDFGTPAWVKLGDTDVILTAGGYAVRASDGKVLAEGLTTLACKTVGPLVSDHLVLFSGVANQVSEGSAAALGVGAAIVDAFRLPDTLTTPLKLTPLWKKRMGNELFFGAPVLVGDRMIGLDGGRNLKVVDLKTGDVVHERVLDLTVADTYPSPVLAGDHLYLSSSAGDTAVLDAKAPYTELARNKVDDDEMLASPVFRGDRMYLRTTHFLYAIKDGGPSTPRAPSGPATVASDRDSDSPGGPAPSGMSVRASPGSNDLAATAIEAPAPAAKTSPRSKAEPKSGLDFAYLGGGSFHFGCEPGDQDCDEIETLGKPDSVGPFWLAKTEAPVEAYDRCVRDGTCTPAGTGGLCNTQVSGRERHPINCIDFKQAQAFCHWLGGRLPTHDEWEFAAKNGGSTRYPWGNTAPTSTNANICDRKCHQKYPNKDAAWSQDDGWAETSPVGSFPKGASRDSVQDLAGNVWEWTEGRDDTNRIGVRGGGWDSAFPRWLRSSYHPWFVAANGDVNIGVRCALPAEEVPAK
jgi:formylglycine-generating enzyme required for sulfatase activity/outer membrane protein assembly factor BamB